MAEFWDTLERRQRLQQSVDLFPSTINSQPDEQIGLSLQFAEQQCDGGFYDSNPTAAIHQWDTHSNNDDLQSGCFDYLFQYVHQLGNQLETTLDNTGTPLIETTTVVVLSEMGRTPVQTLMVVKIIGRTLRC